MPRSVSLPQDVSGKLFLHAMPGRHEPFEEAKEDFVQDGIQHIVCLAPMKEVHRKSPDYALAIESLDLPWSQQTFPVVNFGVPKDPSALLDLAHSIAQRLRNGERVLIHCGAGIGRTGTLAVCVLMALAMTRDDAYDAVRNAGSCPETEKQRELVSWVAKQL